jgi:hypothetical protein
MNFSCQEIDYSNTEHGRAEMILSYAYFINKIMDLFDTVRKFGMKNCHSSDLFLRFS